MLYSDYFCGTVQPIMKKALLAAFVLASTALSAQDIQRWSLQKCITYALEHNISVKQADINVQQQQISAHTAELARYPSLNFSAGQNFNFGRSIDPFTNTYENQTVRSNSFNLSSGVTLYNGGRITNNIELEKFNLQVSEFDYKAIQNNIALSITNAYLNIIFNRENLHIQQDRVKVTQTQLDRIQKLVDAGSMSKDNLLNIKAQLASEERNVVNAENSLILSKLSLEQLLQLKHDGNFDIDAAPSLDLPTELNVTPEQVMASALGNLPEFKREEARLMAAYYQLKVAQSSQLPSITAFGNLNTIYSNQAKTVSVNGVDTVMAGFVFGTNQPVGFLNPTYLRTDIPFAKQLGNNLGKNIGLSLSMPIFNNGQIHRNIEFAKLNQQRAEWTKAQTENQIYQTITQAVLDYQAAVKDYEANKKALEAQAESFEFAEKRFKEGLMNSVDYVNLKNNKAQAESNLLQAQFRLIFRYKIIQFYQGKAITL